MYEVSISSREILLWSMYRGTNIGYVIELLSFHFNYLYGIILRLTHGPISYTNSRGPCNTIPTTHWIPLATIKSFSIFFSKFVFNNSSKCLFSLFQYAGKWVNNLSIKTLFSHVRVSESCIVKNFTTKVNKIWLNFTSEVWQDSGRWCCGSCQALLSVKCSDKECYILAWSVIFKLWSSCVKKNKIKLYAERANTITKISNINIYLKLSFLFCV